ncbi:hypothetical protein AB5I41_13340 [Sphingomonas sp. MMS24-JH45]
MRPPPGHARRSLHRRARPAVAPGEPRLVRGPATGAGGRTDARPPRRRHSAAGRDAAMLADARARVDAAKVALGERGPVWWSDGAPDLNRHMARTTVYADWYAGSNAL